VMIFKDTYEDLTATQLEHIIDRFEAGKGRDVAPGPQVDRIYSAPVGGPSSLNEPEPKKLARARRAAGADEPQVPPSNAARPKTRADETDPTLKTPVTAKAEAAANVKVR